MRKVVDSMVMCSRVSSDRYGALEGASEMGRSMIILANKNVPGGVFVSHKDIPEFIRGKTVQLRLIGGGYIYQRITYPKQYCMYLFQCVVLANNTGSVQVSAMSMCEVHLCA